MDNDELSKRRLEDLTVDAAKILESEMEIRLEEKDAQCVCAFLVSASKCTEAFPEAWQAILSRLRQDSSQKVQSTWVKVAGRVLEELKDVWQKEEKAARRIQHVWRWHVKNPPQRRGRCTNAHEMLARRNAMQISEMPVGRNPSQKSEMPVGRNPSQKSEILVGRNPSQKSEILVGRNPSQKSEILVGRNPSQKSETLVGRIPSQRSDKTLVRNSRRSSMFTTRSASC